MKTIFEKELTAEISRGEAVRLKVMSFIALHASVLFLCLELFVPKGFFIDSEKTVHGLRIYIIFAAVFAIFAAYEMLIIRAFALLERKFSHIPLVPRMGNAFIESSLPTIIIIFAAYKWDPVLPLYSPMVFLYFLFISLSALRLDPKLCVFSGIVSAVEYFALFVHASLHALPGTDPQMLNVWWHLTKAMIILAAGFATGAVTHSIRERISRTARRINETAESFSRFVPHEFLTFLGKTNIEDIRLGDQVHREMTILFSDIRSYTSLSEKMTPQQNIDFLNSYLMSVSPVIRKNGGFIDKYIGDAIMALFPGDPDDALEAAKGIHRQLEEFNAIRKLGGEEPIAVGVGIHTGNLMLGTIGEANRLDTTVISDAVNTASRLESLTKEHGVRVIISRETRERLKKDYPLREIGSVRVKGKNEPVVIYEYVC
jgi:class 3 adenylate cyclase